MHLCDSYFITSYTYENKPQLSNLTQMAMTCDDLPTQFKQIITQPKRLIWNWNFHNRILWVIWFNQKYLATVVQSYPSGHDLSWSSHPIKTNICHSAKTWYIQLKLLEYDPMDYLI